MASGTPTSPAFPLSVSGGSAGGASGGMAAAAAAAAAGIGSPLSGAASAATSSSAFHSATSGSGSRPGTPSSSTGLGSMGGISVEEVRRWSQSDIGNWLHSLRLGAHVSTFAAHDISGAVLLDVEQAELKEMGITSIGDRIRVFTAIKNLKKRCAESAAMATMARNMSPVMTRGGGGAGEMEYLQYDDGVAPHHHASPLGLNGANGRRALHSRPPPLHLSQSSSHDLPTTPTAPSPVGSLNGGQGLGLKEMRGLAQQPGGRIGSARSPGVLPKGLPELEGAASLGHRKMASTAGTSAAASFAQHVSQQQAAGRSYGYGTSRPSTATGASSSSYVPAVGRGMLSGAATSPTSATHAPQRPSTSDGARLHSAAPARSENPLTPITESSMRSPTTPSFTGGSAASRSNDRGYAVRHGPFSNPRTASSASSPASAAAAAAQARQAQQEQLANYGFPPPSLEDLKRRTIKFIGEDGTTRIVNVSDCLDAHDVLARVLRKFGKSSAGNSYAPTAGQQEDERELEDGEVWGIFATSGEGKTKSLTDNELLAICHAPQPHDPLRERGLTLRRLPRPDSARAPKRNKLESFFGERLPSQAPHSPHFGEDDDGERDDAALDAAFAQPTGKKLNRASTVSIMSGLGVVTGGKGKSSSNSTTPSNSSNRLAPDSVHRSPTSVIPRKARNFFGQRPPSELISSHLTDYFPQAEKRVLERTARRSIYGRPSASVRSKRDSTWSFTAELDPPPLPGKESIEGGRPTPSIHIGTPEQSDDEGADERSAQRPGPPMLPPVIGRSSLDDWSKSLQTVGSPVDEGAPSTATSRPQRPLSQRRASGESTRSRRSLATQLRVARGIGGAPGHRASMVDRSDAASMLTVDEITQEVEMRRASTSLVGAGAGWVVDEDGVPIPAPANAGNRGGSGSIIGSTRPSSHLSAGTRDDADSDTDPDALFGAPKTPAQRADSSSPAPSVPGEESDQHRGDPMAVVRGTTSRASSVSELRQDAIGDDTATAEEDEMDTDEEYDNDDVLSEEEDEDGGVFHSAVAGRSEPIKWIKGALIGAGSFGNVFLGMNAKNGLLMAVKQVELPSGDSGNEQRKKSMLEALEREIELLKTMQHENIVQYLDSSADGTHLNIFLEYVPGGSVVALLRNYGAFEELLVRNFVRQILQGLSYLHAREIVHRDIKGANILVDNKSCVKISDFGISKKVESDLLVNARAHRPSLQGSVFWMAPEVVKQTSYTRKADIWSLGCLVVEMISGTHPWANLNQMQALFKIGKGTRPETPDDISQECIDFLNATFELDHNDRPSADELLQHAFITGEYTGPAQNGGGAAPATTTTPTTATAAASSAGATSAAGGATLDDALTVSSSATGATPGASSSATGTSTGASTTDTNSVFGNSSAGGASGGTSASGTNANSTPANSVRSRKKEAARKAKDAVQAQDASTANNAGEADGSS